MPLPVTWIHSSAPSINHETDEVLIARYRQEGNLSDIGILFNRYTHLVFAVCFKYLRDEEKSRDAVMQIFESLITDLKEHEVHSFKSWIYSVAKNHCLMQLRHEKTGNQIIKEKAEKINETFMESEEDMHLMEKDSRPDPEKLREALGELKEEQRICIEMMYLQERSYKEIAGLTGYDLNQVKSYIQNGKRNLRLIFERRT